jgi:hypothetical protein
MVHYEKWGKINLWGTGKRMKGGVNLQKRLQELLLVGSSLELPWGEDGAIRGESFLDDFHTGQHLLFFQPATDDLDTYGETVHCVRIVEFVEGTRDVVHLSVFLASLEIAGKGVDFLFYERDRQATGRIIELKKR